MYYVSHVWTVALRPQCAAAPTSAPLRSLLSHQQPWGRRMATLVPRTAQQPLNASLQQPSPRRAFSSTPVASLKLSKSKRNEPPKPKASSKSPPPRKEKLQPVPMKPEPGVLPPQPKVQPRPEHLSPLEQKYPPLPTGPLSDAEATELFGPNILPSDANMILRIIQHRRVTGELADKGVYFPDADPDVLTEPILMKALEWLRERFPVDEEAAAAQWAAEEVKRLEMELNLEKAQKLGIYKKDEPVEEVLPEDPEPEAPLQGTEYGRQKTGTSVLVQIRKEAEEKRKKEEEEQKALEALGTNGIAAVPSTERKSILANLVQKSEVEKEERIKAIREKVSYYEKKAQLSSGAAAPEMPLTRRLGPSFLVLLGTVAASALYAYTYTPPETRLLSTLPPSWATMVGLTAVSLVGLAAWRLPPLWPYLNKYFVQVPGAPHALGTLLSTFSHMRFSHLAQNFAALLLVGPGLHDEIGRGGFLALYVATGALGSFASLAWFAWHRAFSVLSLGASPAVFGILAARCLLVPQDGFALPGLDGVHVPLGTREVLAAVFVYELLGAWKHRRFQALRHDHWAHLGGFVAGLAGAECIRRSPALGDRLRAVAAGERDWWEREKEEAVKKPADAADLTEEQRRKNEDLKYEIRRLIEEKERRAARRD